MRLIDVDEIPESATAISTDGRLFVAWSEIVKTPTIDPESLRPKGRWIWNEEDECWVCSNCELSALNNYRGNSTDSNYCPNCGAMMEDRHG